MLRVYTGKGHAGYCTPPPVGISFLRVVHAMRLRVDEEVWWRGCHSPVDLDWRLRIILLCPSLPATAHTYKYKTHIHTHIHIG